MGLLLNQLLEFIEQKIEKISNSEDMEEFSDILMKIFENKIFPIQKLNFVQYIPYFVLSRFELNINCK